MNRRNASNVKKVKINDKGNVIITIDNISSDIVIIVTLDGVDLGFKITREALDQAYREALDQALHQKGTDNDRNRKSGTNLDSLKAQMNGYLEQINDFIEILNEKNDMLKKISIVTSNKDAAKENYTNLNNMEEKYGNLISIYKTPFRNIMGVLGCYVGCRDSASYQELCVTLGNKRRQLISGMEPKVWGEIMDIKRLESIPGFPNLDWNASGGETGLRFEDEPKVGEEHKKIAALVNFQNRIKDALKNDGYNDSYEELYKIFVDYDSEGKRWKVEYDQDEEMIKNIKKEIGHMENELKMYRSDFEKLANKFMQRKLEWEYIDLLREVLPIIENIIKAPDSEVDEEQWAIEIGKRVLSSVNEHKSIRDPSLHFIWIFPDDELCRREDAECLRADFTSGDADWPGLYYYYGELGQYEPQILKCIVPGRVGER